MAVHITKQRAAVSEEFQSYIRKLSEGFIREIKKQIDYNPRLESYLLNKEKVRLARHVALLKDPAVMDMEITRLRNLPYTKFEVIIAPAYECNRDRNRRTVPETTYLSGTTLPIVCKAGKGLSYDMGPYRISFSIGKFGLEGQQREHFIPLNAEFQWARFWHHHAHDPRGDEQKADPLFMAEHMNPSTCWGTFGTAFSGAQGDRNVSGLFRTAYDYLTRANLHSKLATPTWCKEIA